MTRHPVRLLPAALLCIAAQAAHADGEGHVRALRERTDIVIRADHTMEQTVDYTWRAVDAAGAGTLGQQYVSWDARRQALELLAAETIPANGAPIPVEPAAMQVQEGILGGVSFPEKRLLQVTFPQLAAGDAIRMRYRLVRRVVAGNPRGWCTPGEYQALRHAMNRISRAMNGRLVFVLNDTEVATATTDP